MLFVVCPSKITQQEGSLLLIRSDPNSFWVFYQSHNAEMSKSIVKGIGIGFLSCIGIGIGIAKTISQVLVLVLVLLRQQPKYWYWYWYC